jgi:hypothetical protein
MMNGFATIVMCSNKKDFCSQNFWLKKNVHLVIARERQTDRQTERERDKAHGQLENTFFFNGVFLGGDQWGFSSFMTRFLSFFFFLDCS